MTYFSAPTVRVIMQFNSSHVGLLLSYTSIVAATSPAVATPTYAIYAS